MTNSMIQRMYCYVVAHDTGFAPNPFHGLCTLACCKPWIRQHVGETALNLLGSESDLSDSKLVKDLQFWVVGLVSETVRRGGLILYAMQVSEILTYAQYWNDPRFREKKPSGWENGVPKEAVSFEQYQMLCGDNIYKDDSGVPALPSFHTIPKVIKAINGCGVCSGGSPDCCADDKGKYVLVSDNFVYSPKDPMRFEKGSLAKGRGKPIFEADSDRFFERMGLNDIEIIQQFDQLLRDKYNSINELPNSVGKPNSPFFTIREG